MIIDGRIRPRDTRVNPVRPITYSASRLSNKVAEPRCIYSLLDARATLNPRLIHSPIPKRGKRRSQPNSGSRTLIHPPGPIILNKIAEGVKPGVGILIIGLEVLVRENGRADRRHHIIGIQHPAHAECSLRSGLFRSGASCEGLVQVGRHDFEIGRAVAWHELPYHVEVTPAAKTKPS